MKDPRNFVDWVCDPARTNDELFTVECLIEVSRCRHDSPFRGRQDLFEERSKKMKARATDPAYRPALHRDEIEALACQPEKVKFFSGGSGGSDRPIRDLQALAFFPALTELSIGSDVSDLSPLSGLPHLKRIGFGEWGDLAGGYPLRIADCGEKMELESLHLSLRHAWPDLRAVSDWPALVELRFNGNPLACEEISALPRAQVVHFKGWLFNTPLRDLHKLPEMPSVKQLIVESTNGLEGIERYPSVVNLEVAGIFRDLTPLAAMPNITALTLTGEFFRDLAPLSRMPKLREVRFVRERAIDLSPLADCPKLRRVEMERCAMMRTEVAALNAGLLPEALDFLAEEPRSLEALKFFTTSKENEADAKFFQERRAEWTKAREQFYDGDAALANAEIRAMGDTLQGRLDELLGRGWGLCSGKHDGPGILHLKRYQDTMRAREVIEILREESTRSRFPWHFLFSVEPHGDMSDELAEIKRRDQQEIAPEGDWLADYYEPESVLKESEEHWRMRQHRYEFIEREHLLQLHGEEGVDPALLSLLKQASEPEPSPEPEPEPVTPPTTDEDGGGVAIAPPPPPPPETKNLGEELAYYLDVYEDCIVANQHWAAKASYNLGLKPVEWTPAQSNEDVRSGN